MPNELTCGGSRSGNLISKQQGRLDRKAKALEEGEYVGAWMQPLQQNPSGDAKVVQTENGDLLSESIVKFLPLYRKSSICFSSMDYQRNGYNTICTRMKLPLRKRFIRNSL